jgi:hypothetical protein
VRAEHSCYPFFAEVAAHVGKLLALNGDANLSQIVRRMTETWGDRSTLLRAVQRVLRSMVQWGALREGTEKGVFIQASRAIVSQLLPIPGSPSMLVSFLGM